MTSTELSPLLLSLRIAALASLINLGAGLAVAWLLARGRFPGHGVLDALTTLPLVLPPTVLGYYLLVVLGHQGVIGRFLEGAFGVRLVFTWQAAVMAASIAAFPLFVQPARAALEGVDCEVENAARILGRSELAVVLTITLPLAWRGILTGLVLAFVRSLGEFGVTLMVAGNIPGQTRTMSIAIYDAVQAGRTGTANILVVAMTVVVVAVLIVARTTMRGIRW
jgi:molybdate transport system permease protein